MRPARALRIPLCLSVLLLLLSVPAHAAPRRYGRGFTTGFEFSTSLSFVEFDDEAGLDDEAGFGFRFGAYFNPRHEIEFLAHTVTADDLAYPGAEVDLSYFQFAYVHNFTSKDVVPYLTAGLGFLDAEHSFIPGEDTTILSLGGGVRFFLSPVFHLRFEFRHNMFEGEGTIFAPGYDLDFNELAFGVGWRIPT